MTRVSALALWCVAALAVLTRPVGASPVETVDLASTTAWTINGAAVTVPGNAGIGATSSYFRSITIPASAAGRVVKVLFGACNYGCEVYLGTTLITAHKNIDLPFEADLTGKVTAGQTYTLEVRAHNRSYYGDRIPMGCDWSSLAYGIGRYVKLVVYPQVYIKDYFVRPSVTKDRLEVDVWVHNASAVSKTLSVGTTLSSWNNDAWAYPAIPSGSTTVSANSVAKITLSTTWGLGPDSYWWANVPFSETYQAKLHYLNIDLKEGATSLDTIKPRFGFVEYGEGLYYYTINGVRIGSQPSDGTSEAEAGNFAYTSQARWTTDCAESFKRYMRMGVNTNRTHSSIPTVRMMEVADEIGFWLIPESAIRGFEQSGIFDSATYCDDVREMALTCRNHPSVCRYSVLNEYNAGNPSREERLMIDAGYLGDPTRPLVTEGGNGGQNEMKLGLHTPAHAFNMKHYSEYRSDVTRSIIRGMGEYNWRDWAPQQPCPGTADLMRAADMGLEMRKRDWSYFAIWDWYQHYRTFLTETSTSLAADKVWFMKRCLNPYVACDSAIDMANPCYSNPWPSIAPLLTAGSSVTRKVYLFNGGFRGSDMKLVWELRWGSATGTLAATGSRDTVIQPGFYQTVPVTFTVPSTSATTTPIAVTGGTKMYEETKYYFSVGGSNLHFVLKSYLMTPAARFAVRPGSVVLDAAVGFTTDVGVTTAQGALPTLAAQPSTTWLSAVVSGSGASQRIRTSANASTLAPGIYRENVVLSAGGFLPVTVAVEVHVGGGSAVSISPTHAVIASGSTASFAATLRDALGALVTSTFNWVASGGGTIGTQGLFTSNGSTGTYEVTATVSGDPAKSAKSRVTVVNGKPIPAGLLPEMLLLTTAQSATNLPLSGPFVSKMDSVIAASGSDAPCHAKVIGVNGTPYTWRSRYSSNGLFLSQTYSSGFGSVIVLSPTQKSVKMLTTHCFTAEVFRNGEKVGSWGSVSPWAGFDETTFTLNAGANVMMFKLVTTNQGFFSIKFSDLAGAALTDVQYVIDTCGFEVSTVAPTLRIGIAPRRLCTVRTLGSQIEFAVNSQGAYKVDVVSARGQIVRTLRGAGAHIYRMPRHELGAGFYVVRARDAMKRSSEKLVVW